MKIPYRIKNSVSLNKEDLISDIIHKVVNTEGLEKYDILFEEILKLLKNADINTIKILMQIFTDDYFDRGIYRTILVALNFLYYSDIEDKQFTTLYENLSKKLKYEK